MSAFADGPKSRDQIAAARRLIVALDAMVRDRTPWRVPA
jgi:hypothetical protein